MLSSTYTHVHARTHTLSDLETTVKALLWPPDYMQQEALKRERSQTEDPHVHTLRQQIKTGRENNNMVI